MRNTECKFFMLRHALSGQCIQNIHYIILIDLYIIAIISILGMFEKLQSFRFLIKLVQPF